MRPDLLSSAFAIAGAICFARLVILDWHYQRQIAMLTGPAAQGAQLSPQALQILLQQISAVQAARNRKPWILAGILFLVAAFLCLTAALAPPGN